MRHIIVLQALEPISHGDTVTGVDNQTNTRLFMRSNMIVNGKPARVPDVSENALRSVLFREPLHDDLLRKLEIKRGDIPQSVVNLLFSGGNMAAGSKSPGDEISLGHQVKNLYPSLDLLGGAVDGFILPRSRLRLAAWPVCKEYAGMISMIYPALVEDAQQNSAFDLLAEETRTRGTGAESEGNQMLYTYETMAAGTKILIEITLDAHSNDATRASLSHSLSCWDGYFGGQARQGRGRMAVLHNDLLPANAYTDHIDAHADAIADGLRTGTLGTNRVLCK